MFEEITKEYKVKDYLALFSILAVGLGLFLFFAYNRYAQKLVILATAAAYVAWGIIHHWLEEDFHWRILIEYIVVASLVAILLLSLLSRT